MDKKKLLSSLAAAGILTASVLGANVNASTNLTSVGVYKNLVAGKTVVPYVLKDSEQPVTVKDVRAEFENLQLVNGNSVTSEDAVLKTGNTFKANNIEYTVLVYGDVNGDGELSTADANIIQQVAMNNKELNAIEAEVADVSDNDGRITTKDASAVQQFVMKNEDTYIDMDKLPPAEEDIDSNYTLLVNDNGFINTENVTNTVLKVSLEQTLDTGKTLDVVIKGQKDGVAYEEENTVVVSAHTDYVEKTGISLSNYDDGNIQVQLLDGENVVATVTSVKNTVVPNATNVITDRVSTKSATLSLEACGDSDITKVYYAVAGKDETISDEEEIANEITVSGNKISAETVSNELDTNTAYKLFYVLENSYGSKSEIKSVMITTDAADVTEGVKVDEIIAPKLDETDTAEFTWTGVQNANYVVTLYKDGKAVATKTATNASGTDLTVDFTAEMAEVGTYKIAVYAEATENSTASEVTESAEVTVSKLTTVTDLAFRNDGNDVFLSWDNPNDVKNFQGYTVQIVEINEKGEEVNPQVVTVASKEDKEVKVTDKITTNKIYKARVTVNANANQGAIINSDETVSSEFYKVGTPAISNSETTETSVTLSVTGINIPGKTTTYKVNIYNVNESANPEEAELTLADTKNVEIKDGTIVIDGLKSNSPYKFKLVANVDGEEVESGYTAQVVRTLPVLTNLTVVGTEKDAAEAGKVFHRSSEDTIVVAGEVIELANYNNSAKLEDSMDIISALKTGDVVSIEDKKVTLKLDGGASAAIAERDLSSLDLEGVTLDIESNNFSKTIKVSNAKEVILRGTESIFNIKDVTAEKITLTDGVEVVGEKTYIVNANSSVTINGAKMTTEKETEVLASANTLTITVNEEANDLVFENKKNADLTINFKGLPNNTSAQSGSIVIKSNGGTVKVSQTQANVNAELTVEVTAGTVEVNDPALTGDKNITVALKKGESTTIKAISATKAPVALTNVSVDITDEELLQEAGVTEDNLDDVKAYIASFGLNGTGATITTGADNNVTITFTNVTSDVNRTIGNIA